jgi:hypothetical protein
MFRSTDLAVALYTWVSLAVIVWIVATTIARARVFRPLRKAVKRRSDYLGEGISCQYCISHWIGFLTVLVVRPHFLPFDAMGGFYGYFTTHSFAVIGLAALIARTIGKTPPDGVPHPDVIAELEEAAR